MELRYNLLMDPNLQTPLQVNPDPNSPGKQISEASGSFMKKHYEGFLRSLIGLMFSLIGFIKFSITNIIKQVFSRD